MKTRAMMTGLAMLIALPVTAQDMFFYPSQGQSTKRQNKDKGERHVWAVEQSGFDPATPHPRESSLNPPRRRRAAC